MIVIIRPAVAALLLLIVLTAPTIAQQKRQTPAKPQPKAAAPAPAPTFDTLIPAESYTLYGEVRSAGTLIQSNAVNEVLEPILNLAGPPKEFKSLMKWLNTHAEDLMSSRLLVATWPTSKNVPETLVAIEFASAEDAAKFATKLNQLLPTVLPPVPAPTPEGQPLNPKAPAPPPEPAYRLQQAGSLILLTPRPLDLKKLKPAGAKLLAEDNSFRAARNRFSSEPIFVFIDVKLIERQEEERRKQSEEEAERRIAEVQQNLKQHDAAQAELKKPEEPPEPEPVNVQPEFLPERRMETESSTSAETGKLVASVDPVSSALTMMASSFFSGDSKWPDAVGLSISFEGDSFDIRALLVNSPGEKSDTIPFVPMLIPGPPLASEASTILPADTELFATMSLDLPQIYATMSKPRPNPMYYTSRGNVQTDGAYEPPFAAIEKQLKMNLKDDLLPLLGSEIAIRLPVTGLDVFGVPRGPAPVSNPPDNSTPEKSSPKTPVLVISVKDKEGMRAFMPKFVEAVGFKGASAFANTERKEDTELVSYVNLFAYAFIGDFLVISSDAAATRHVVDSYLKHETLSSDNNFRSYTRWQPRPAYGQLYISPALMESYKSWILAPSTRLNDQTKAFMLRLVAGAQPITYSLSNEGFGPLHELHVPRNLILMAVAGISSETNPTPVQRNEGSAIGVMYAIASVQEQFKKYKGAGSYGTLEQLIAADLIPKELVEKSGYKFEITFTGDKFEVYAVPVEYGKTGTISYFIDQTMVLRGADRGGASAISSDPRIY
jgi:hypothetical protein